MNKTTIAALVTLGLLSGAIAQLSPSQKELIEKYKSRYVRSQNDNTSRYSSPDIYDDDTDTSRVIRNKLPKDRKIQKFKSETDDYDMLYPEEDSLETEAEELKLFGYDIFRGDEESFQPGVHGLPPEGYQFGPGDNILVNVWGRVDLELALTVDREGKVFVPKVGEIIAAGATLDQFKDRLNSKLNKIYSGYNLSVTYGKLRQITIYVFGEVEKPGGYTISSLANLLNALYIAGGTTEKGSLRQIQIVRNTRVAGTYDLYDLLLKGDNSNDLKLQSGDVVYVPVVGPLVAVAGEVRRPAIYELSGEQSVSEVLSLAGGLTPLAYMQSISIDRVGENDSRILLDLNLADSTLYEGNNIKLQDGDRLTVYSIYDFHENLIHLTGHVKHPGLFGMTDSMRISDIISNGDQLKENAYTKRADLFRFNNDATKTLIAIELDKILIGDKVSDIMLQPLDSIVVYSYDQVTRKRYVQINGEIKLPGEYELYNAMKLSDLIFLAGNLTRQAYLVRCEIARTDPGHKTDIIEINLEDIFDKGDLSKDIHLLEDDHVFIRQIPDWRPIQMVNVEGEVMFPGQYAIRNKDERLSDILGRAGGLSAAAFPEGAIYIRSSIENQVKQRNIGQIINNTREYQRDSLGNISSDYQIKYDPKLLNRVIIDLPTILVDPHGVEDIVVADSDYIYIPTFPSGVQVIGSVAFNGTISYIENKKADYYLNQAGGLTPDGDKNGLRLVKPNGKVYYGRKARGQKIDLGDALVIPSKIKKKTDWGKILVTTATVVSSMATTILVVDRLK